LSRSTTKSEVPLSVRAVTRRWVANGALIATIFDPRRVQPSRSRSAVVDTSCQWSPDDASATASATTAVPSTIFSSSDVATGPPAR
jgi:hypothetical protein